MQTDPTAKPEVADVNPMLKLSLELGPLLVFFFANARGEWLAERFSVLQNMGGAIFVATGLFMIATAISLGLSWILLRRIPVMPLVSGIVVLVFGAMTLYLQDDHFIKIKPTIVNTLFGLILLGGLAFRRSLLSIVFQDAFKLNEEGWRILTLRWGLFFIFLAIVNEIVWRNFDTDTWVAFKVWGIMPITVVFSMAQMPILTRYALSEQK